MRKLIRLQLVTAVQFESPLGVSNSVSAFKGPQKVADITELKNGDVEVRVVGPPGRRQTVHVLHHESIVDRLYENVLDDATVGAKS